jgi:hypothetical protein
MTATHRFSYRRQLVRRNRLAALNFDFAPTPPVSIMTSRATTIAMGTRIQASCVQVIARGVDGLAASAAEADDKIDDCPFGNEEPKVGDVKN